MAVSPYVLKNPLLFLGKMNFLGSNAPILCSADRETASFILRGGDKSRETSQHQQAIRGLYLELNEAVAPASVDVDGPWAITAITIL
jgi:hypothetical protein